MAEFVRADIGKLESFVFDSEAAIKEFGDIRTTFEDINKTLLDNWDGVGRSSYKSVSDHILEKVGGIQDVLNTINDTIVKDLISQYNAIDKDLAEQNRKAGEPEEGAG